MTELAKDMASLNERLLGTLDEKIFFAELTNVIRDLFLVDEVVAYRSMEGESVHMIAQNGNGVNNDIILKKGESLASYIIKTKQPYYSNNVVRDPLFSTFDSDFEHKAELGTPIISQGVVIATIHLVSNSETIGFSQETVNDLTSFLKKIERPMNNIKMYLSAKRLNESLLMRIERTERELKERTQVRVRTDYQKIKDVNIIGNSEKIKNILGFVNRIAPTESSVLVLGESGTGKDMVARKVHCASKRANGPFVVVNCGAIQESLLESEFFGHEKGSFTGAVTSKQGLVEKADNGTLFLDEIAELSPGMQTKLLRFLEQREAYRVGGITPYQVNTRIIAATNKELKKEVDEGRFREDLYYRLNTITVNVPSLRERKDDIALLAVHFLNEGRLPEMCKVLTPGAVNVLKTYNWPGNIRELKNIMERAYILSEGKFIDETCLTDCVNREDETEIDVDNFAEMTLSDLEKRHICRTLKHLSGNKTKTAKTLGITVKTLYNKLHSYGMIQSRETNV